MHCCNMYWNKFKYVMIQRLGPGAQGKRLVVGMVAILTQPASISLVYSIYKSINGIHCNDV